VNDRAQLAFAFSHGSAMDCADFLVAASNAEAVAWLRRWPHWPTPALILHGPPGCGKTHMAFAFAKHSGAALLRPGLLDRADPHALLEGVPAAVVDDADDCVRTGDEATLLHLFNLVAETGRNLLLTGGEPPARWPLGLADLRSRLNASCIAGVDAPDEALMRAVLGKLFVERQLHVGEEVLSYLLARTERSLTAAALLIARIDEAALAAKRPVTIPLVRAVLAEQAAAGSP
jgi:DnaA regulatory inactivator Hda